MTDTDCVVIGAGVIGLAVARTLAQAGREVLVLEKERLPGSHTSSRNSEVIHAGIYYEPNSLKARTCVAGRELLYRYCRDHHIEHRQCGKLVVATDASQVDALERIEKNAKDSGVTDLEWLDGADARLLEPELACSAALSSPSTGILDTHAFMLSLLGEAQDRGAGIAYQVRADSLCATSSGVEVYVDSQPNAALRCRTLINAAGLDSVRVASSIEGFPKDHIPDLHYAKGSYFTLSGRTPFSRLIYPIPERGGLGIHMTIDMSGRGRFGPDVEWISDIDYRVDENRAEPFYRAARRYWPGLRPGCLHAAYAGIRPKLSGPGEVAADFCISGPLDHGIPGIINLYGIESPGLTASLALAERIAAVAAADV
jgi:L-2-hydroxyglutarate oxidase LhgO